MNKLNITTNYTISIEYENAHRRILSCQSLPNVPAGISEAERSVRVSSLIPLDSINMVHIDIVQLYNVWLGEKFRSFIEIFREK